VTLLGWLEEVVGEGVRTICDLCEHLVVPPHRIDTLNRNSNASSISAGVELCNWRGPAMPDNYERALDFLYVIDPVIVFRKPVPTPPRKRWNFPAQLNQSSTGMSVCLWLQTSGRTMLLKASSLRRLSTPTLSLSHLFSSSLHRFSSSPSQIAYSVGLIDNLKRKEMPTLRKRFFRRDLQP